MFECRAELGDESTESVNTRAASATDVDRLQTGDVIISVVRHHHHHRHQQQQPLAYVQVIVTQLVDQFDVAHHQRPTTCSNILPITNKLLRY